MLHTHPPRLLLALFFPLLAVLGLLPQSAQATHGQSYDLSYINVAPNVYVVTYRFYRDCSGIPAPASEHLSYRGTGCGLSGTGTRPGGTITLPKISTTIGAPYGQPGMNICVDSAGAPQNYEEHIYRGTLTLDTAQASRCSNWVLSIQECNRPNTRNLAQRSMGGGECIYAEVRLNNRDVNGDSSPVFGASSVPFVEVGQLYNYNMSVVDPDGDSLSFSLVAGMHSANAPVQYDSAFSPTNPILTSTPFAFDAVTGDMMFTPSQYVPITPTQPSDEGLNKYLLVVQADSWRTINGQPVRVSSVRRDMLVIVVDSTSGQLLPRLTRVAANGNVLPVGSIIEVEAGQPLSLQLRATDANPTNVLEMTSNADYALSGATFQSVPGLAQADGEVNWTPTAAHARSRPYYFTVTTRDNALVRGFDVRTIAVRVRPAGALGLPASTPRLAIGAAPNPFTDAAQLTVQVSASDRNPTIFVYDAAGRLVDRVAVQGTGEQRVSWRPKADLKPGLYYARFQGAGASQTAVLSKQ